jgi:undecaprenyl-diphosphatase
MTILQAIVLGVVQGATEFLPVSSSGHLILARGILGLNDSGGLAYDAVLQLATALALVVYFRRDLWNLFQVFLRIVGRLPADARDAALMRALIAGTVPAVILGLLLEDLMDTVFRNPLLVACVLVAGSVLFAAAELICREPRRKMDVDVRKGFIIGLFQSLALVPGMSRSGASIVGGMFMGLSRVDATRFSFLLAIPIVIGAGGLKLLELISGNAPVLWVPLATGSITAFVVGLAAIHFMLRFVRTHTLWPFVWYRVVLAGAVVLIVLYG